MTKLFCFCCLLLCTTVSTFAQTPVKSSVEAERPVDPTFLRRYLPDVKASRVAMSSPTAHYKPLFGEGDANSNIVKGVSRFGEITIDPNGTTTAVSYAREVQVLVVLEGEGTIDYAGERTIFCMSRRASSIVC